MRTHKSIFENTAIVDEGLRGELLRLVKQFPKISSFIETSTEGMKVKNYVGVLETKSYEVDILPKVWRDPQVREEENFEFSRKRFLDLFTYSIFDPKYFEAYRRLLSEKRSSYLKEFIIMLFTHSLQNTLNKGIYRTYVRKEDALRFLRGKLLLEEQLSHVDRSKFFTRFYDFSGNNKLNQVLSFASYNFRTGSSNNDLKERLSKLSWTFDSENIEMRSFRDLEVRFNRMSERFEVPYNYATTLLEGGSLGLHGKKKEMMFLYDMNYLFEKFLYNFISKNRRWIFKDICQEPSIRPRPHKNFIIGVTNRSGLTYLEPDIKVGCGSITLLVDAKNKENYGELGQQASREDLFQMHAYSIAFGGDSILFYPSPKKGYPELQGPYLFHDKTNYRLWFSTMNLDFNDGWKDRLRDGLKRNFEKVLEQASAR